MSFFFGIVVKGKKKKIYTNNSHFNELFVRCATAKASLKKFRESCARCPPSPKSKSSLKYFVFFFFSHFSTALRACKRNSVGFGCSVDKRSLAATLGSSGNVNVFNARPRKRERPRERAIESKRARAWSEQARERKTAETVREAAKLGSQSRRKEK